MKNVLYTAILLLAALTSYSQDMQWAINVGGTGTDISYSVDTDPSGQETLVVHICTEVSGFLFFASADRSSLRGVLKLKKEKLDRSLELNSDNSLKGTWTDSQFYFEEIPIS
ncbi:MAG: hypothetical protein P8M05_03395 [Flavobacteriales bacterium]|nr:hypothetical protein [Flavobacteriales bacterium]